MNKPTLSVQTLLGSGFAPAGQWRVDDAGRLRNDFDLPARCGVYAFAMGAQVLYVGLASRSLRQRLYFYGNPGASQRTNIRMNGIIKAHVSGGQMVHVFIAHPDDTEWSGLPVKGAEGLEAGLIERFALPWNMRGTSNAPVAAKNEPLAAGETAIPGATEVPAPGQRQKGVRGQIYDQIRRRPGMTELELAKSVYGPAGVQQQANAHCRKLVADGHIERRGSGGASDPFTYYPKITRP